MKTTKRFRDLIATEQWSPRTDFNVHGIAHGRSCTAALDKQVALDLGIEAPIYRCFLASLAPGGFIIPHIDQGPYRERWHIPIQAAGFYWEEGMAQPVEPPEGEAFLVRHHVPHAVFNPTDTERIHLIIDRDVPPAENPPNAKLELTTMLPEIGLMIATFT